MVGPVCDYSADFPLLHKPRTLPRNQAKMITTKLFITTRKNKSYQVTALSCGNRQTLLCLKKLICILKNSG